MDLSSLMFVDVHCRKPCAFAQEPITPAHAGRGLPTKKINEYQ
jgi:hypothetical protein